MRINKSQGFTLIEMLVATAIIITSTTVVVAILATSFRSVDKTTVSEDLRQSGNSAISRMSRLIQFADSFQGASDGAIDNAGEYDTTCVQGKPYRHIKIRSSGSLKTISCTNLSVRDDSTLTSTPFIDPNEVEATYCVLTCVQNDNTSPIIGITFNLARKIPSPGEKAINFSTSAKMRNR